MIWNRVPKAADVGINIFRLGIYDAISHFNRVALDVLLHNAIHKIFVTSYSDKRQIQIHTLSVKKKSVESLVG